MKAIIIVIGLAVATLAGCAAPSAISHDNHKPPAHRPLSVSDRAAAAECKVFTKVNDQITATQDALIKFQIVEAVREHFNAWNNELQAAANIPDQMGVPAGHYKARDVSVDVLASALALSQINLLMTLGKIHQAEKEWTTANSQLTETLMACAA